MTMQPESATALALVLDKVRRVYGSKAAVDEASLTLPAARITCLLGPSGCGKSTLLRLIAGLEPLDGGRIAAGPLGRVLSGPGTHVPPEQRDIGFVFQDYALFPHMSVADNVAFGLKHFSPDARRHRASIQLERVQLSGRADAFPQSLSGGEQQRVALARALAREPGLVLLDEPFSGLDSYLKTDVRDATLAALRQAGTAALIVTHDAEEALMMADDLALMDGGHILQTGTPQDCYRHPVSLAAARLLGPVNAIAASIQSGQAHTALGILDARGLGDGPATALIRPEAVRITKDGIAVRVVAARFAGAETLLTLRTEGQEGVTLQARTPSRLTPAQGSVIHITLDPEACRLVQDTAALTD
jgi:iron(III) transport system ATP-binding protein